MRHGIDPGFLDELVAWVAAAIDRAPASAG
jgi:hypothetical protein